MEADPTSMVGVIRTEVALKTVRLHARRADRAVAARDRPRRPAAGVPDPRTFVATTTFAVALVGFTAAGLGIGGIPGLARRGRPLAALPGWASGGLLGEVSGVVASTLPVRGRVRTHITPAMATGPMSSPSRPRSRRAGWWWRRSWRCFCTS